MDRRPSRRRSDIRHEIEERLEALGTPMPHLFLAEIAAGVDPRGGIGVLRELTQRAVEGEEEDGRPALEDWEALKDLILNHPAYAGEPVPLPDSTNASRELLTYLAPKLKAVEVAGTIGAIVRVAPLTEEEIALFNDKFLDDF